MNENILEVRNLKKYFPVRGGIFLREIATIKAVDGVTFSMKRGESLGLVGETGSGKTTLGLCILLLLQPTSGEIRFLGRDITRLRGRELRELRSKMAIIFQDPFESLNPRHTVADIVGEPMEIHNIAHGKEKEKRVIDLLIRVGLEPEHIYRYPHEFSGGQRQRIAIARALSVNPELVVADEPVAALDVSIRAHILNLMKDLQRDYGLTYLFISHDLSSVRYMCNRVMVMYLGKIVEMANTEDLFNDPKHIYTKALISAIPALYYETSKKRDRIILTGEVPSPMNPPSGCRFHPRCPEARPICKKKEPELINIGRNHLVACHFYN